MLWQAQSVEYYWHYTLAVRSPYDLAWFSNVLQAYLASNIKSTSSIYCHVHSAKIYWQYILPVRNPTHTASAQPRVVVPLWYLYQCCCCSHIMAFAKFRLWFGLAYVYSPDPKK